MLKKLRHWAPYVPIIGVLIVVIYPEPEYCIWSSRFHYWASVVVQAVVASGLVLLIR